MNVVFCSSEVFPFAKTGGLADVSGTLPHELARKGCAIKVFQPLYKGIKPKKMYDNFGLTRLGEVDFYFIKNDDYYWRDGIYGTPKGDYPDNLERFSFFSRQVLEVLKKIKFSPDIMHCNDWQSAMANVYLKLLYAQDNFFAKTKTILTIHNMAYQGLFVREKYPYLGIPKEYFTPRYFEFYDKVNLLKGGIIFSDLVTTVSPTYAREIKTSQFGCGLEGVLQEKGKDVIGILNAIDYDIWDPAKDKHLYKKYSPENLSDKAANKIALQKELGIKVDSEAFLLSMVSRLAEQKGLDILSQVLDEALAKYQLIVLGFGEEYYHNMLKAKSNKFKSSFSLNLKFDEALAHKIYAASDAFLMPSRFEPCGLSQMISYKYATVPIVHHTGGLADTVIDVDCGGGGFEFSCYSAEDLLKSLERAFNLFKNKQRWQEVLKKIVTYNFSWEVSAKHYLDVYKRLINCPDSNRDFAE